MTREELEKLVGESMEDMGLVEQCEDAEVEYSSDLTEARANA